MQVETFSEESIMGGKSAALKIKRQQNDWFDKLTKQGKGYQIWDQNQSQCSFHKEGHDWINITVSIYYEILD